MEIFKKYKAVILIVLPLLILVLIRSAGSNHFKPDAAKLAEPSFVKSNIINVDQLSSLPGDKLIINLSEQEENIKNVPGNVIKIAPGDILMKENINKIKNHAGEPVLLYSKDVATVSRIWMVLTQMGIKNIFILTADSDNELMKHEFRPDTLLKPEF
jgi:hypothetical protein